MNTTNEHPIDTDAKKRYTEEQLREVKERFRRDTRDAIRSIRQEARDAKKELREQEREYLRRIEESDGRIDDTFPYPGIKNGDNEKNISMGGFQDHRQTQRTLKQRLHEEAREAEERIKERAERFENGIKKIRDDVIRNPSCGKTSPIDAEGNYRAADRDGTINNYNRRLNIHTEQTRQHIRRDVIEAVERMDERTHPFGIKR